MQATINYAIIIISERDHFNEIEVRSLFVLIFFRMVKWP